LGRKRDGFFPPSSSSPLLCSFLMFSFFCWFPSLVLSSSSYSLFGLLSSDPISKPVTISTLPIHRLIWSSSFSLAAVSTWVSYLVCSKLDLFFFFFWQASPAKRLTFIFSNLSATCRLPPRRPLASTRKHTCRSVCSSCHAPADAVVFSFIFHNFFIFYFVLSLKFVLKNY
jgi:hypothetical protein